MKVKTVQAETKSFNNLIVAYDISKKKHNYFTSFEFGTMNKECEGVTPSNSRSIAKHLTEIQLLSKEYGFDGVCIVCEPTGGYEKGLLRQARRAGFHTLYVSGEATHKAKVIESNDSGKNDRKDARVIHMLATMNKTLTCHGREDEYAQLKYFNGIYEDLSLEGARIKNAISRLCEHLFPDLDLDANQYYSKLARCIAQEHGFDPYRISALSLAEFESSIAKVFARKISGKTAELLERIWRCAQDSKFNQIPQWQRDELAKEIKISYKRWKEVDCRKDEFKQKMIAVVETTQEWKRVKESSVPAFMFSRILAESGPWDKFHGHKQLLRFAGLNLRERQSGTFKGDLKLSKKGNVLLRKVLGQLCYSKFVKKGSLYREYYLKKKAKHNGFYGLACVMRKVLKMLFGLYKSQTVYCESRVFEQNIEVEKIAV